MIKKILNEFKIMFTYQPSKKSVIKELKQANDSFDKIKIIFLLGFLIFILFIIIIESYIKVIQSYPVLFEILSIIGIFLSSGYFIYIISKKDKLKLKVLVKCNIILFLMLLISISNLFISIDQIREIKDYETIETKKIEAWKQEIILKRRNSSQTKYE